MGSQQSQMQPSHSPPSVLMFQTPTAWAARALAATPVLAGWFLFRVSQEMSIKILASTEVNSGLNQVLLQSSLTCPLVGKSQNVPSKFIFVSLLGCLRIYSRFLPEACDLRESETASKAKATISFIT